MIAHVFDNASPKPPTRVKHQYLNKQSHSLSASSILLSVPLAMATLRFTVYENPSVLSSRTQSSPEFWLSDYERSDQQCPNGLIVFRAFISASSIVICVLRDCWIDGRKEVQVETEGGNHNLI